MALAPRNQNESAIGEFSPVKQVEGPRAWKLDECDES